MSKKNNQLDARAILIAVVYLAVFFVAVFSYNYLPCWILTNNNILNILTAIFLLCYFAVWGKLISNVLTI